MSKILEKSQELGELLADSEEYLAMKKAETILEDDKEALQLLDRFDEKQNQFSADSSNSELKEELQSLQEEMLANEKVNNYFQTRKQFNQLMNEVSEEISNILYPDQGGCSCGDDDCC